MILDLIQNGEKQHQMIECKKIQNDQDEKRNSSVNNTIPDS